jgi:tetratricopeptide (TPR) repeat protein
MDERGKSIKLSKRISKRIVIFLVIFIIFPLFPKKTNFHFQNPGYIFAQVKEQDDPFYVKLLEDGKYFYDNGNYAEAIASFEIAFFGLLDNPSRLLECYVYLTVCYYQVKNGEKSKFYYDEIKKLKLQEYTKTLKAPGNLLDKYYEISSYFSRLEPQTPPSPSTSSQARTTSSTPTTPPSSKGRLDAEIKQLKRTIKNNPRNSEAYFQLSTLYIEQRKIKEAKSLLEDLIKVDPRNGYAYFELGKISLSQKKEREALVQFQKAAPFLPANIELHYEMAKIYYYLKNFEQANQEFEEVKKINENYKETEKYLNLLEGMKKGGEKGSGYSQDLINLARQEKNFGKKMGYYQQAVEKDPLNAQILSETQSAYQNYFEMSSAYQVAKKYKEAAGILEVLLKYYPKNIEIYTKLGDVYISDKSFDKAIKILEQGKRVEENNLELRYVLGKAYMGEKNYKAAAIEFNRVLAQYPNYKDTPQLYRLCIEKLKK